MPPSSTTSNWDFTPVINLLQSPARQREDQLTSGYPGPSLASHEITKHDVRSPIKEQPLKDGNVSSPKLGDFGALWELLGNTSLSLTPQSPQCEIREPSNQPQPSTKPVFVLKRPTNLDTPVENPVSLPRSLSEPVPALSFTSICVSASKYNQLRSQIPEPSNKSRPSTKSVVVLKRPTVSETSVGRPVSIQKVSKQSRPSTKAVILNRPAKPDTVIEKPSEPRNTPDSVLHNKVNTKSSIPGRRRQNDTRHDAVLSDSNAEGESDNCFSVFDAPMIPLQVGVSEARTGSLETPPSSFEESNDFLAPTVFSSPPGGDTSRLRPIAYRTASDQRVGLLTKLLKNFPDYAELLIQAGRVKDSKRLDISSRPVHIFVDMSNIMVGFHDTMKATRNIPVKTRIRRLPLSYQNFSLILERGRPAAKRVLVGSDRIAATSESEQLGYEANILNRVQKIKSLTPRQLKFRKTPRLTPQDGGHSSETNDGPEERWVEQGVDEILHLKILESLLDTDEPATIVLATGDAAEAEYSGGFMKMVERALQRGWKVELVSFSQVTSYAYRKKEFRSRWGSQFEVIALDDYVEEMLKM
ncbi:hypothetical protein BDV12DRAFT_169355 [Aspergillus spectabilis]